MPRVTEKENAGIKFIEYLSILVIPRAQKSNTEAIAQKLKTWS
jgi:hypothetical protein